MDRVTRRVRIGLFASTISVLGLLVGSVALASPVTVNGAGVAWQILPTTLPPLPTTLPPLPTTLPPLPTTLPQLPTTLPPLPTTLPSLTTTTAPLITTTTTIVVTTTTLPNTSTTQRTTTTLGGATTTQPSTSTTAAGTDPLGTTTSTVAASTTTQAIPGGGTDGPGTGEGSGNSTTSSEVDFAGTFLALGPAVDDRDRFFDFTRTPVIDRVDTAALALGWLFDRDPSGLVAAAFSPFLALLTIWDAIRSAGSGLIAPSAGLAAVVIGAIADRKSLILRLQRLRGVKRSAG